MGTLIQENQTILLWAAVLLVVAVSIVLEQRYRWAAMLGSVVLCIFGGLLLSNCHVIPFASDTYNSIGNVVLLVSIPLFLFKANVKQILKDSGKLFILFHIAAVGTLVGVLLAYLVFQGFDSTKYLLTIISAAAVGGTVNCVAMGSVFAIPDGMLESYLVIGNFVCGTMVLLLRVLHNTKFIRGFLPHPLTDEVESAALTEGSDEKNKTMAAAFWGGKEIGLKDIAVALAASFTIVGVSSVIANWVVSLNPPEIIKQLFGSVYLIMTLLTALLATVFHKFFGSIRGAMELGNIGLMAWFVTIGISGNLVDIIRDGALSLGLLIIVIVVNIAFAVIGAKLIRTTWEDAVISTVATVGGPPTAAAVAISFGWREIIVPGILVGLWGYIVGNYFGIIAGNILGVPPLF
ncbi:MAG: DUF819 domain-containing protein [Oscillospiraceae bacterium]